MAGDRVVLRPVTRGDVETVAAGMRPADVAECAWWGLTPLAALEESVDASCRVHAVLLDGDVAGLCGLAPNGDGTYAPWLLATDYLATAPFAVARVARRVVAEWQAAGPLRNRCDTDNAVAVRLIRHLGFTLEVTTGERMATFTMEGACALQA